MIGTNAAGTDAILNWRDGILLSETSGDTIGGASNGAGNVISGNGDNGIRLSGPVSAVVVAGNRIGTNVLGNAVVPNRRGWHPRLRIDRGEHHDRRQRHLRGTS